MNKQALPAQALVDVTRQLGMLARLGYPLAEGMRAMGEGSPRLGRIAEDLEKGDSLPQAARRHPKVMSPFYASMLEAAEASEKPEALLAELSRWLEQADSLRERVRVALLYPFVALNVLMASLVLLTRWILPDVLVPLARTVLESRGGLPPWVAPVVDSQALTFTVVVAWLAINVAVLRQSGIPVGASSLLPWSGRLQRLAEQGLWARALGSLLATGMDLPKALDEAASVVHLTDMRTFFGSLGEKCRRGSSLSQCLQGSPLVDSELAQSIASAEAADDYSAILLDTADRLGGEVGRRADFCVRMAEPWATAGVGLMVLGSLALFWWPFYTLVRGIPCQ